MKITGRAGRGVVARLTAGGVLALFVGAGGAVAQVTVDDFGDTQAVSTAATSSSQVPQTVGTILGGERDMEVSLVSGAGTVTGDANTTTASALTFSVPSGATGRLLVTWDGADAAAALDPVGLGGADLTAAGANALKLAGITVTGTVQAVVEVYTDAANVARSARQVSAAGDLILPFGQFLNKLGTPNFGSVGAITLELVATGAASIGIADLLTVAPAVQATKVDLVTGGDLDGRADPGETVTYTIEISTTGGTAEGVSLEDTVNPSQLTFATGSLEATPLALDDSFGCLGNVGLDVAAPGLLGNDTDPDGSGLATPPISAVDTGSTVGTVVVDTTTGAFTYDPPAGFKGVTTFTYTIDDDDGNNDIGTVTLDCSQVLWFIDNSATGANLGTLADPFTSLAAFDAANGGGAGKPAAGDCAFIEETGTEYTGGVTLLNGQRLVGEGATVDLGTACGVTAPAGSRPLPATGGTRPKILNGGGAGITLAQDNALRGLDVGNTSGAGISGSSFGTLTVREMAISGTGPALDLDNGTLDAEFASIASTSGAAGIDLDTVGGSLEVTGATTIDGTTGTALKVASAPGGSFDFGDTDLGVTSTVDQGIDLTSNAGATFTFDSLDIDADNGKGLNANASGTVNIGGTAATIAAAAGPALDLESTTLDNGAGGGGWSLARVSSTNSPAQGIDIDGVTGNLTVDDGNAGTFDDVTISGSTNAGIDINSSAGTFTFDSVDIDSTGSHGVLLSGSGPVAINGGGIDGATGDGVNSTNTALTVDFVQIGANSAITDDGIEVVNSDSTARTVTLQNNNIFKVAMSGGIGNRGIFVNASGSGPLTADVRFNQIASANETILTTDGGTAGSLVLDLGNSTLERTSAGFTERHVGSGLNSTIVKSWTAPNQVVGTTAAGILFNRISFDSDANPGNGFQQVNLSGTLQIGSTLSRVAGDGLSFLAPTGNLRIGTLNIANTGGTGLKVDTKTAPGPTTFNLAVAGGTVDTTSGTALNLDPLTGNLTFASVSSTGSPAEGVKIDGLTATGGAGTNALTIDNSAGGGDLAVGTPGTEGIEILSSTGNFTFGPDSVVTGGVGGAVYREASTSNAVVSYRGTLSQSSAASVVSVSSKVLGSTTFTKQVTGNTSVAHGIFLSSNTGSVSFTGGLDVDTTSGNGIDVSGGSVLDISGTNPNTINTSTTGKGFEADGGGTLTVTGNARIDTSVGTGTGVDIQNTTIGAAGATFRSVSVNGAANGIVLNNTGSTGGFTVTGDGTTTMGVLNRNGSGGTIQNTTDDGVFLNNANNVTLRQMNIRDVGNTANSGDTSNTANDHAVESRGGGSIVLSAVHIQDPIGTGWEAFDITGVNRIDHDSLIEELDRTSNFPGLRVTNTNTSFTSFTIDDSKFDHKDPTPGDAATNGNAMVVLSTRGTAGGTWNVTNSNFTGARGQAMTLGVGDTAGSSGTVTSLVSGNVFEVAHGINGQNNLGMTVQQSATLNPTITGNTFRDVGRGASNSGQIIVQKNNSAILDASISGNTIHTVTAQRGIEVLSLSSSSGGKVDAEIFDNNVYSIGREGVFASARGNEPDMDVRVFNNCLGRIETMTGCDGTINALGGQNMGAGILIDAQGNSNLDVQVDGNQVIARPDTFGACGGSNCGVLTINVENFPSGGALVNATVEDNILNNNNAGGTNFLARARDCGLTLRVDLGGGATTGTAGDGLPNTATGSTTTYNILDDSFGCGGTAPTVAVENLGNVTNDNNPTGNVSTSGTVNFAGDVPKPNF